MPRTYLFFVSVSLKRPRGGFSRFFLHFLFLISCKFLVVLVFRLTAVNFWRYANFS